MQLALGQLELADAAIKPGDVPDIATAQLHTATFHLLAAIAEIHNPQINDTRNVEIHPRNTGRGHAHRAGAPGLV
jgi:hypothetical protein